MDSPLNQKAATEVDVPVWDLAHKTLDTIADDMRRRLNDIEHTQARLAGEGDALRSVLNRISPPPPQPNAGVGYLSNPTSVPPRW